MNTERNFYVTNRDLLPEIHLSKISYCSFHNKETDHQHDIILASVNEITPENIDLAKTNRANRLKISFEQVLPTDLVFRVKTWEHIPFAPPKQPKYEPKKQDLSELFDFDDEDISNTDNTTTTQKHIRPNFPPFFHYRVDENMIPYIVGKSHWKGSVENGEFCKTHGKITHRLASMFMMLTERYATKGNWRGYSYIDEMKNTANVQLSWGGLQFDESKSSNPFAFYTTIITNAFRGILLIEKKNQNIRDDLLEIHGLNPSWTRQNSGSYDFSDKHGSMLKYNE